MALRLNPHSPGSRTPSRTPPSSTLVRSLHDLHGVFDMTPFVGLFRLSLALACQGILRRMGDGRSAMPFQHLSGDGMDLGFGHHGSLLMFADVPAVPPDCRGGGISVDRPNRPCVPG